VRLLVLLLLSGCAASAPSSQPSPRVFALGQVGVAWRAPTDAERAAAEKELLALPPDDGVIEALGKVGGTASIAPLARLLATDHAERAAIAIALIAKRDPKLVPGEIINELDDLLDSDRARVRWATIYALGRLKREETRPLLLRGLGDRAPLVRATAAKFLADVQAPGDEARLTPLLDDADVRVAAEAARTLARRAVKCDAAQPCPAIAALAASSQWRAPVMAAIAFEPVKHPSAARLFGDRFEAYGTAIIPDANTRNLAQCQAALAHDRVAGRVELIPRCQIDARTRDIYAARISTEPEALLALSQHAERSVRAAAAESMGALADEATAQRLIALIDDADSAVVGSAADSIEKRKLSAAIPALRARLAKLSGPDATEALQAIASALAALGAKDAVDDLRALAKGTPFAVCLAAEEALTALGAPTRCEPAPATDSPFAHDPLPKSARVRIVTTQGTLHATLFPEAAPSTVRNFLGLVRKKFFDGLSWHRVVPGFVSQGGDPQGDGSGGPGWTIPCEINPHRYDEGTLGMALSGRDTGGSQWFITHTPQPHLDGRYTVFGQLTDGLDVVIKLVEGDRIVEVREE
jgi:cyclophilin family peptidyl-prolyl cis-trans isomerase/HEAT repeat protein